MSMGMTYYRIIVDVEYAGSIPTTETIDERIARYIREGIAQDSRLKRKSDVQVKRIKKLCQPLTT